MRLKLEFGVVRDDPGPDDIRAALAGLRYPDDKFAILESGPEHYLQAYLAEDGSLSLEYRDGSAQRHYEVPEPRPVDEVIEAFLSYQRRDNRWRTAFEWRRLDLG